MRRSRVGMAQPAPNAAARMSPLHGTAQLILVSLAKWQQWLDGRLPCGRHSAVPATCVGVTALLSLFLLVISLATTVAAAGAEGEKDQKIVRSGSIGSAVLPPRLTVAGDADEAAGSALVVETRDVAAPAPVTAASASARRLSSGDAVSWSCHLISTAADGGWSVFGIDVDGDGDIDTLSASWKDDTIAWYENLDGSGGSWSYHMISTAASGATAVFAIDVDGDGDVDTLSASCKDDLIAWYENLDGSGGSWGYHEISTAADFARSVFGIDVDGDGDVDVVSASMDDNTIAWSENLDGSGGSWSYHEIYTAASQTRSVSAIDLDGDDDVDVLSASIDDDTIAWYENLDGSGGSWSYHEIYTTADGATSVFGIDLDGDGDVDVLSASSSDNTIAWSENLDGSGGSWSYHEIYTAADGAQEAFGIDVDGDGDVDVFSASATDDTFAWYENLDGSGGSWSYHEMYTTADYAISMFGIDVDGDGDIDALSAAYYGNTIAWCVCEGHRH